MCIVHTIKVKVKGSPFSIRVKHEFTDNLLLIVLAGIVMMIYVKLKLVKSQWYLCKMMFSVKKTVRQ